MRVKRSVNFRIAPKKSSKGKGVATEPSRDEGWKSSKCSNSDLESLVKQGFLPSKSVIQWRPALGNASPYENTGEIVGFLSYFERGLGLPCSNFFYGLLYYYGIQLHHLTPTLLFTYLSLYICVKLFWASSLISTFSATFFLLSPSLIRLDKM